MCDLLKMGDMISVTHLVLEDMISVTHLVLEGREDEVSSMVEKMFPPASIMSSNMADP